MTQRDEQKGERIAKLLARAGIASRREVERMIADGRIALDGAVLDTPATILPGLKGVTVDGKPVAEPERTRLFRFHKPPGLLTAERDPAGRATIYDALRNALPAGAPRLMPIGRLDLNTEGLLLLTNDGELKRQMELPASGVPRTYRARAFGDVTQAQLEELIEGVEVDGVRYGRIDANMERRTGRNQWIELTLAEGKNREVRRVLEHLGLTVSRLIRTSYGPFHIGDLPRGAAEEIRKEELERFRSTLRGGPRRPAPRPAAEGERREAPPRTGQRKDDRRPKPASRQEGSRAGANVSAKQGAAPRPKGPRFDKSDRPEGSSRRNADPRARDDRRPRPHDADGRSAERPANPRGGPKGAASGKGAKTGYGGRSDSGNRSNGGSKPGNGGKNHGSKGHGGKSSSGGRPSPTPSGARRRSPSAPRGGKR